MKVQAMFTRNHNRALVLRFASILMAMGLGHVAQGQYVVPSGPYPTIEDAIMDAGNGAQIYILAGTHVPARTLDTEGKNIHFVGEVDSLGNPLTLISGAGVRRIVNCRTGESSQTIFQNLAFVDGVDHVAGAMFIENASPTIINCAFINNESGFQAGALYTGIGYNNIIRSCLFMGNSSTAGGAVHNRDCRVSYQDCIFIRNEANSGGALQTTNSLVELENCSFFENNAATVGGGAQFKTGISFMANCTFTGNQARDGGGAFNYFNDAIIENCIFDSNTASRNGGGSCENGSEMAIYRDCSFTGNHAMTEGGGIHLWGDEADLSGCRFEGNWCGGEGGGVMMKHTLARFRDTVALDNQAMGEGGFLSLLESTVHLDHATIKRNESSNTGGIHSSPTSNSLLVNTTVCDNTVTQIGGPWIDNGMNCIGTRCDQCSCQADLNGDDVVNGADLVAVIGAWGNTSGPEDLNGDGIVDSADLTMVLGSWGACP